VLPARTASSARAKGQALAAFTRGGLVPGGRQRDRVRARVGAGHSGAHRPLLGRPGCLQPAAAARNVPRGGALRRWPRHPRARQPPCRPAAGRTLLQRSPDVGATGRAAAAVSLRARDLH
jgi:hypothetical protein